MSGRLTPFRLLIVPPTTTLASIVSASSETASSRTRPSSISSDAPGRIALKISGCGSGIASPPPSSRPSTKRTVSPAATWILPSSIRPTRILGPWRSWRMAIGRPVSRSSARMAAWTRRWSSCVPWLKFSRNTSAPARNSSRSRSGVELAGPMVATILA